jgi:hypothetical protein
MSTEPSYSHQDKVWLERLQTNLKPLVRDKVIDLWDDTQIQPGAQWRIEIQRALAIAKVAVLLVSPDFLASDFIAEEELPILLDAAKTDGLTILWVPIRSSIFTETRIADYQAVHDPAKPLSKLKSADRDSALVAICKRIKEAAQSPASVDAHNKPSLHGPSSIAGVGLAQTEQLDAAFTRDVSIALAGWSLNDRQYRPTSSELQRLIYQLTTCSSIRDEANRQAVLQLLREDVDGFDAMIEGLRHVEGDSLAMQLLDTFLQESIFEHTIPRRQQAELQHIVKQLPRWGEHVVHKLYARSAPQGWIYPRGYNPMDTMTRIIRQLGNAPITPPHDTQALVTFVQTLAGAYTHNPRTYEKLLRWLDSAMDALGVKVLDAVVPSHDQQMNPDTDNTIRSYLLIVLAPKRTNPNEFFARPYLIPDDSRTGQNRFQELPLELPLLCNLETFTSVLQHILNTALDLLEWQRFTLTVEVFVPHHLLFSPLDSSEVVLAYEPIPVGLHYPVVVRAWERISPKSHRRLWKQWRDKWDQIERLQSDAANVILWAKHDHECSSRELSSKMLLAHHVCVACTFAPTNESRTLLARKLLETGMPIAICPRQSPDSAIVIQQALEELLYHFDLRLPDRMLEQRRLAHADSDHSHLGYHVTLVWDDPNRLPPTDEFMGVAS